MEGKEMERKDEEHNHPTIQWSENLKNLDVYTCDLSQHQPTVADLYPQTYFGPCPQGQNKSEIKTVKEKLEMMK